MSTNNYSGNETTVAGSFEEFEKARQELHEHWHNARVEAAERLKEEEEKEEEDKAQSMLGNAKDTVKHAGSTMADIAGSACTGVPEAAQGSVEAKMGQATKDSIRNIGDALDQ